MKILVIIISLIFVEFSIAQETIKTWFIPASCSDSFHSFIDLPYNVKDGVSYISIPTESLPVEYEDGLFVKISHPKNQLIEKSIQANIIGIYEKCTRNSSFSLSRQEFNMQTVEELVEQFGGDKDNLSIKINGEDVIIYF